MHLNSFTYNRLFVRTIKHLIAHVHCVSLITLVAIFFSFFLSCSTTKFVPQNDYLLNRVKIKTNSKDIPSSELKPYLKQTPNSMWFSIFRSKLYIYDLAGRDSSSWINKMLWKIGEKPVLYSSERAADTQRFLTKIMQSKGYMQARVKVIEKKKKKKVDITYLIDTNEPYRVGHFQQKIADAKIDTLLSKVSQKSKLKQNMRLDAMVLNEERDRISTLLHNNGYYAFNKDHLRYDVDTISGSHIVDLDFKLLPFTTQNGVEQISHPLYYIGKIHCIPDFDVLSNRSDFDIAGRNSLINDGVTILYKKHLAIRPDVLTNCIFLRKGDLYDYRKVQKTYRAFARMDALRYTNIKFKQRASNDTLFLDTYILLTRSPNKSVSFELGGTNSAGDLGAAMATTFQHRNLFHGMENLSLKFRGAFEVISGLDQHIYRGDTFQEYSAEAGITFPRFLIPFATDRMRHAITASSVLSAKYDFQLRPEFTRNVAAVTWGYKWGGLAGVKHRFNLVDVNYLYMPWISKSFRAKYLDDTDNSILAYNYEDRFLFGMSYSFQYNSLNSLRGMQRNKRQSYYSLRFDFESAGNLLYGLSSLSKLPQNSSSEYTLLNTPFAQYLKAGVNFASNRSIDANNSIAYHFAAGVAYPYGNAQMVPFEKRYFSGGANSVRGWTVRSLGPGSFKGDGNFMNQSGDIKLEGSVELRTKLFWKLQGALFVDAGNIWTIRQYDSQVGGEFKLDRFYKQIAVAYGMGLRLDLDFFVIRVDGGMKAVNPINNGDIRLPIIQPKLSRDLSLHLAVGYPF